MHVVVVNDSAVNTGGANRVAIDTCLALAERGEQTRFVHAGDDVDAQLEYCRGLKTTRLGIPDLAANQGFRSAMNYLWSRRAYRDCAKVFAAAANQHKHTVVHVHSFGRCFSPAVFAAARQLRLPVVLTLHDYFAFSPNGLHYDFQRDQIMGEAARPLNLTTNTDRRLSYHILRNLRLLLCQKMKLLPEAINHFISVSQSSGAFASRFLPEERITTIYSPIEKVAGRAEPWKQKDVVFLGRLSREKGVAQLARATRELGIPVRFVGDGPDTGALRRANPTATITGWQDAEGVRKALLQARVVVLPSRWQETFGICVAEAMSLGIPVIVSRLAGSAEWVTNNKDGIVFDPYLEGDLERALRLIRDDNRIRAMSERAYHSFSERDTTRASYADRLCSVYERILNRHSHAEQEFVAYDPANA